MSSTISKQALRQRDGFYVGVRKFFDDLSKHSKSVVVLIVVVFAATLIGALMMSRNDEKSDQAREVLYRAQQTLRQELIATAPTVGTPGKEAAAPAKDAKDTKDSKPALLSDDQRLEMAAFTKLDVATKLAQGVKSLEAVIAEFPGTRSAYDAKLAMGDLYADHGDPAQGVTWYQQAVDASPSTLDRALSLYALGTAFENSGKKAEAIQAYEKAVQNYEKANPKTGGKSAEVAPPGLKGDLLMAIARCYEGMNDKAKAISTYDQVIAQMPNTRHAKSAELFKAQLR